MLNRGRGPKLTRTWWVKKCFYFPHSTWLKNSMSDFGPDAAQTFSSLASDCGTTILSGSSFSPPLHSVEQLRCRLAADYQTPHLCSLSDVNPLSQMHNNVPTHAGIFFHFRLMARSPSSVTSQGRGCTPCMTITAWIAWLRGTSNSQPWRFCEVLHHQLTTNTELAQQECNCFFKAFW